jgi:hypothetical protein
MPLHGNSFTSTSECYVTAAILTATLQRHHKDSRMATKFPATCYVSFVTNTIFGSKCMNIVKFEHDRTHKTQAWIIQCGMEGRIIDWKFEFHSYLGCRHYSSHHPISKDNLTIWKLHNILAFACLSNTFHLSLPWESLCCLFNSTTLPQLCKLYTYNVEWK